MTPPPRARHSAPPVDRAALAAELQAALAGELASAMEAHAAAVAGATHEEARPENDKDTRGLEQSYLARGLAQRVAELETALLAVAGLATQAPPTSVRTGALVTTEDDDGHAARYWVCPAGGGLELAGAIKVITPSAPLGRALLGHKAGDELELVVGGKRRTLTIVAIA
ncbi:MAG: GreA/GreB family elongation factor [Kofleriaceae bacterium]|nr:GreA/GreB family elongation factor [Kofleriaceae bacterium]MBP6839541.1 GreA/GreB family elongation factor [Kofleriaceae bacterium]MBP9207627.1 GreA/GreB family elongation factor [Kofleriaceae bacterium]